MADTIKGTATIFGVDGSVTFADSAVALGINSQQLTDEFEVEEIIGGDSEVESIVAHKGRKNCTLELRFKDGTGVALPAALSKITTASMQLADLNGDWNYIGGGSVSQGVGTAAKMTLPVRRYAAGLLATPA